MKWFDLLCRAFLLVGFFAVAPRAGAQEARPAFTVEVPASSFTNANASSLAKRIGDATGNTLYIIDHSLTQTSPGAPSSALVGRQLLLVKSNGQLIASGDFPFPAATIVRSFGLKRLLVQNNSAQIEEIKPVQGTLTPTGVVLLAAGRSFESQDPDNLSSRFIDAVSKTNGKVSRIERFNVSTLIP
jgi:hypothetical protein